MTRTNHFSRRVTSRSSFASPLTPALTWDVQVKKLYSDNREVTGYKNLQRSDNKEVLNIVKAGYNPGTNEKFMSTVSKLHELTGFKVDGYSEFDGGRKVLAYLRNESPIKIAGFDTNTFLVLGNSFDYSMSWFSGITTEVIRCTNAFSRIQVKHRIRHDSKLEVKIEELIRFYQRYMDEERALKEKFETWHGIRVPEELKELFADHVLDIDPNADEDAPISKIKENQRSKLAASINDEIAAMGNNMYGLFNGLTHYTTHVAKSKDKVFGNVLGHTANLNRKGFQFLNERALELA